MMFLLLFQLTSCHNRMSVMVTEPDSVCDVDGDAVGLNMVRLMGLISLQ